MNLYHCTDGWTGVGADRERIARAQVSWTGMIPVKYAGDRNSSMLGSSRKLRFVHDVLDAGFEVAERSGLGGILVLTNSDVGLVSNLPELLSSKFLDDGRGEEAVYSHRFDWVKPVRRPITWAANLIGGNFSSGIDLVAVTVGWWREHRSMIPDLILGCEGWDWVFKFMIGTKGWVDGWIWHELHGVPEWRVGEIGGRRAETANMVNRMLCLEWWRGLPVTGVGGRTREQIMCEWPILTDYIRDWESDGEQVLKDAKLAGLRQFR